MLHGGKNVSDVNVNVHAVASTRISLHFVSSKNVRQTSTHGKRSNPPSRPRVVTLSFNLILSELRLRLLREYSIDTLKEHGRHRSTPFK